MCVIQFEINAMMKKVIEMLLLLLSAYCVVYYVPVEAQRTSTVTRTTTSTATSTVTTLSKVSLKLQSIKKGREIEFNYWPFCFCQIRWFALNWWTLRAFVDVDAVYRLTSPSFWRLTTNWKNLSMKHFIIFFILVNSYRPEPSGKNNEILKLNNNQTWNLARNLAKTR